MDWDKVTNWERDVMRGMSLGYTGYMYRECGGHIMCSVVELRMIRGIGSEEQKMNRRPSTRLS